MVFLYILRMKHYGEPTSSLKERPIKWVPMFLIRTLKKNERDIVHLAMQILLGSINAPHKLLSFPIIQVPWVLNEIL